MSDASDVIVPTDRKRAESASLGEPDPLKGGDVYGWAMEQAALIRAGRQHEIDWTNVADEIESVGKSEFRSLASYLEIVLLHMLKWDHQPQRRSRSWVDSIKEHRKRVARDILGSPSLELRLHDAIALIVAANEMGLATEVLPPTCSYDWQTIMTRPLVLDQTGKGES